ncbi:MAG TPA: winged helix-turn-helix domain-containing protein [Pseudobdellovibrionaceae bacterium]|nr:winged helix-turn-helix domain-containing protein [Pseudobdellovibrionaceae bacterium]
MKRITLVGPNRTFLQETQEALAGDFDVRIAETTSQAVEFSQLEMEHLVLIDCPPEDTETLGVVEKIRLLSPSTKFIVTSAAPTKNILIQSLNLKVDGFFERPSSWDNLKQRILTAFTPSTPDDIQVDSYRRAVVVGRESIPLTKTEFSLLMLFRQRPGVFLSRDEISEEIWPDSTVAKNNLDTHLSRLRSKIPPLKSRLLCLRGEGFVYTPPGTGTGFTARTVKRR